MFGRFIQTLNTAVPALAGFATACVIFAVAALTFVQLSRQADSASAQTSDEASRMKQSDSGQSVLLIESTDRLSNSNLARIEEIVEIESEYLRMVTFRQMLADLDEQGALDLLGQTEAVRYPNLRLRLQREIIRKLAAIDPVLTLTYARDIEERSRLHFIEVVFEEWSRANLNDALVHARTFDEAERLTVLKTISRARDDLSSSSLSEIARDLGYGGMATRVKQDMIVSSARITPKDSWNQLLEDPWRDYSQIWSLVGVADAWMNAEGPDVLFQIAEQLPNHLTRTEVIRNLLDNMSAEDAPGAFDYARALYEQTDGSIFHTTVFRWAANDPHSALQAVSSLDSEALRMEMLETIATRWAQANPEELLRNIESFPKTAQSRGRSLAIGEIAKTSPQDAIATLSLIPSNEVENSAKHLVYWWSLRSENEAIDWIQNDPIVRDYQKSLIRVVLNELVLKDPEAAMQFALDQPMDSSRRNLEYRLINALVRDNRIDESLSLLPRMREGNSQFEAFVRVGINLIVNKDVDRALGLAESLSTSQHKAYRERLVNAWAYNDAQGLFNWLDNFPDQETKRLAANALVKYKNSLNEEQLDHVKSLSGGKPDSQQDPSTTVHSYP